MNTGAQLCIVGGGTGGHVMPALALANAARRRWAGIEVEFIGAERGLEARLMPERGERVLLLAMHSFQGASLLQKLRVLGWELPRAVLRISNHWRKQKPKLVVGVGGYASVAGVLAAVMRRIPVILYEQNAIPGMVNRKLASMCSRIMLGFAKAADFLPADKCITTGNIVNPAIAGVAWQAHMPPRLIVLGGSQGAAVLNSMVPEACSLLKEKGLEFTVTHVTGDNEERIRNVQTAYSQAGIEAHIIGFCNDMPALYASGNLMISRAGAMTVTEAAVAGLPTLFIPLPHAADDHQRHNAAVLVDSGAADMIDQRQVSVAVMAGRIERLLFDRKTLADMSHAYRKTMPADAEKRQLDVLANWLEETT